ncbi:MAG: hypothetical protein RLY87_316 [Chloroflexota bacterium]|jgi:hypothetical protein
MLPSSALGDRDSIEQKALIVQAIQAHLLGSASIDALAAWALKAFHSLHSDDDDMIDVPEEVDDDADEGGSVDADTDIQDILDMLMFADSADFAPTRTDLTEAIARLRR